MIGLNTHNTPNFGQLKVIKKIGANYPASKCVKELLKTYEDDKRVSELDARGINVVVKPNIADDNYYFKGESYSTSANRTQESKYEHRVCLETKDNKPIGFSVYQATEKYDKYDLKDVAHKKAVELLDSALSSILKDVTLIQDAKK